MALLIFQRPGSNALATADRIQAMMRELARSFPSGLRYDIVYNPTEFIAELVHEVQKTIFEAVDPRRHRRHSVPADLARLDHPDRRNPGVADRHLCGARGLRLLAQQPFAVRAGAGDRHRCRRRDRRRRKCRAQFAARHEPEGGGSPHDGRGRRRADRNRAGSIGRVYSRSLHPGHFRPVLSAIRDHHRLGDDHLMPLSR